VKIFKKINKEKDYCFAQQKHNISTLKKRKEENQ